MTGGPHLLGVLLVLAGLLGVVSPYLFQIGIEPERAQLIGGVFAFIGLFIAGTFSGTLIDGEEKKIKDYTSILGIKLGEWETLPKIGAIKLLKKTIKQSDTPNGISPTLSGKVTYFVISLIPEGEEKSNYTFTYSHEKKANKQAQLLAQELGIPIS